MFKEESTASSSMLLRLSAFFLRFGAAGPSSTTYDTNKAQLESFNSTAIIVIIGVFIVLLFVIRSFWPGVYIIVSLVISYLCSDDRY